MLSSRNTERGAAFVEFAITIPILIVFVAMIIDWSWMLQELFRVRRAFDRAERSMTAASAVAFNAGDAALLAAGRIYRDDLQRIGVTLERVVMNPEAFTEPAFSRKYVLITGSLLSPPSSSLPFPVAGLFQLNILYRPRCFLCKMLDQGLRLRSGSPGFVFNMTSLITIEDPTSLQYFCQSNEALAFTHRFSNSATAVTCQPE